LYIFVYYLLLGDNRDNGDKVELVLVDLTPEKLMLAIQEVMPKDGLFSVINNCNFESAPSGFKQYLQIRLADAGTPFFDYTTTKCGIPKVGIVGSKEDWDNLTIQLRNLNKVFTDAKHTCFDSYLETCQKTIEKITEGTDKFLLQAFTYDVEPVRSGRSPVVIDGWLKDFYMKIEGEREKRSISDYSNHIACLPFKDKDDPHNIKYYYFASGLSTSNEIDGYLYPFYTTVKHQIVTENAKEIFDKISFST